MLRNVLGVIVGIIVASAVNMGLITVGHMIVPPPEGADMRFRPRVLACEPEVELRWRGALFWPALFAGEHFFLLKPLPSGGTRFQHGEDFRGLLLPLLGAQLKRTAHGFVLMNQALKRRVEGGAL